MRILIVEDDAILAFTMEDMLATAGHRVVGFARDEGQAVELATSMKPALALVDLSLARGASGAATARHLLDRCGVPSLFVSGYPDECRKRGGEAGVLGCLRKPFTTEALNDTIAAVQALIRREAVARVPPGLELYDAT